MNWGDYMERRVRKSIVISKGESNKVKSFKEKIAKVHGLNVITQNTGRRSNKDKDKIKR